MHRDDSGMVENGNMGFNRKAWPDKFSFRGAMIIFLGSLSTIFFPSNKFEKIKPDLYLEDGRMLFEYGLDANAIHIPGHLNSAATAERASPSG